MWGQVSQTSLTFRRSPGCSVLCVRARATLVSPYLCSLPHLSTYIGLSRRAGKEDDVPGFGSHLSRVVDPSSPTDILSRFPTSGRGDCK
ncbi:hypothetical protein RRG08_031690 [Elysia crispata]|uniref:Uncharacterized protein n=1 Tax=Elysia crispata TaxID=231223 RepID=A0AAE1A9P0_9GAST|nr:hypothetical protein RRG08_031690 [Elysia crispata]